MYFYYGLLRFRQFSLDRNKIIPHESSPATKYGSRLTSWNLNNFQPECLARNIKKHQTRVEIARITLGSSNELPNQPYRQEPQNSGVLFPKQFPAIRRCTCPVKWVLVFLELSFSVFLLSTAKEESSKPVRIRESNKSFKYSHSYLFIGRPARRLDVFIYADSLLKLSYRKSAQPTTGETP